MGSRWREGLRYLVGLAVALVFVLPLFWTIVASLRQTGLPPVSTIQWWPRPAHWENYAQIFRLVPMGRYLANSLFVVAMAVPLTLLTASLAGFGLSQLDDPWRGRLVVLSVVLLMIPSMAVWLFRYHILRWIGLLDSLWALIAPAFAGTNPLFVLLFYWTFRRIPAEVYDAARLDGAGAWTTWWRIGRPLARPTTIGVTVLAFMLYWSDFVSPILYIYRPENYTLPVGLEILKQLDPTNWPLLMAAAVVMALPVVALFVLLQRYFLHDLSLGRLLGRG